MLQKNIRNRKKRYSQFDVNDLNNPFVQYRIMDFFKNKPNLSYVKFSCLLLNMNEIEFFEFERRKNQFENM